MIRILNLHEVHDINWFDNLVGYLKSEYEMASIEDIKNFYNGEKPSKKSCHFTVDDGQNSFYDTIYPVLKKHNVPVTLFVSPKILGNELNYWFQEIYGYNHSDLKKCIADVTSLPFNDIARFNSVSILKTLQIQQIEKIIQRYQLKHKVSKKPRQNITITTLRELDESHLVTVGAHTMNHPILSNESDSNCQFEIQESVNELANILNHPIKYFSYPNGQPDWDYSEREIGYLKKAGVDLAFTTESKNLSSSDNTFCIPRLAATDGEKMVFLKTKLLLGSMWEPVKRLKWSGEFKERRLLKNIRMSSNTG